MKILLTLPILTFFAKVTFVGSFQCEPAVDCLTNGGNVVPDPVDCTKYYNCIENPPGSGQYFPAVPSVQCPEGTHFDQTSLLCNTPGTCTNACCDKCNYRTEISCNSTNPENPKIGYFLVPCKPNFYYYCSLGVNEPPTIGKCLNGTCYDEYTGFCWGSCLLPDYCTSCDNCAINIITSPPTTVSSDPTSVPSSSTSAPSSSTSVPSDPTSVQSSSTSVPASSTAVPSSSTSVPSSSTSVPSSSTSDSSSSTSVSSSSTSVPSSPTTTPQSPCLQSFSCPTSEGNYKNCDYCDPSYWHCSGYVASLSSCDFGYVFNTNDQYPFCVGPSNCPFP